MYLVHVGKQERRPEVPFGIILQLAKCNRRIHEVILRLTYMGRLLRDFIRYIFTFIYETYGKDHKKLPLSSK